MTWGSSKLYVDFQTLQASNPVLFRSQMYYLFNRTKCAYRALPCSKPQGPCDIGLESPDFDRVRNRAGKLSKHG